MIGNRFDQAVIANSGRECIACRKKDTPNDGLHRQIASEISYICSTPFLPGVTGTLKKVGAQVIRLVLGCRE